MEKNLLDLNQMTAQDKKAFLQDSYNQFFQQKGQDILKEGLEIVDFGCNIGSDNTIVYTLTLADKSGKTQTRFFKDNFDDIKIDLAQLESYKALGMDTSEADKKLALEEGSEQISLKELGREEQEQGQGLEGMDKNLSDAIDNTANKTGMQREDVAEQVMEQGPQSALTNDGKDVKVKIDDIPGIGYPEIDASQKVSVNTTMKDLLGNEFVAFKTIITSGNEKHFFGIDQDGNAQEIGPDKIEFYSSSPSISLMQEDGQTKDVQPDFVIGIKSQGTDSSKRMYIGGYKESSGENSMFVARSSTDNKYIAKQLPSIDEGKNTNRDIILDTTRTDNVNILDDINRVAGERGIDSTDLLNELLETHDQDLSSIKEEDIESAADWLEREPGERVLGEEEHRPPIN